MKLASVVNSKWLYEYRNDDRLVLLDASIKAATDLNSLSLKDYIPKSRYFDIKQKFSDVKAQFPSTVPSRIQFEIEAQKLGVNKDSFVVVYDNRGIYSSARAWWLFKTFGFKNVAVLDGGLPEWKRLGYATVPTFSSEIVECGNFSANYQKHYLVNFSDISEAIAGDTAIIIDARSRDRFNGVVPEPRAGLRSGTIPNSRNLPFEMMFDNFCLKPKEGLKSAFEPIDIDNKRIIFSCGSGITACILALVADILEFQNSAVYDGSWTEYGTLTPQL
ncbi:MAG: sulfurtransferase [Psychroserpens sp.]|uniref:sulfurtransferase n=1 Tax=Psychroserpens sp. TaxID=2020870 RepID=UPI003C781124